MEIKRGMIFIHRLGGEYKIMAVADGYAMARRKGCIPFCISIKEIQTMKLKTNTNGK
jgi:hypothetical protein